MADSNDTFMRFLASWALVHETADEGWKAAVARGEGQDTGRMGEGPESFVDGLSAMIAEEKERLKAELAGAPQSSLTSRADLVGEVERLRFEVSELRGVIESLQTSVDALASREAL